MICSQIVKMTASQVLHELKQYYKIKIVLSKDFNNTISPCQVCYFIYEQVTIFNSAFAVGTYCKIRVKVEGRKIKEGKRKFQGNFLKIFAGKLYLLHLFN